MAPRRPGYRQALAATAMALASAGALAGPALDLAQGYRLALRNDAGSLAVRAEVDAAREVLPQARAQLLPNLSANLAESRNNTESASPGLNQTIYGSSNYKSANYAVTLRQPIYRKYNFALYEQAQFQVQSAEASLDKSLQDLAVRLAAAYFDVLMAQDQLALARAAKEAYKVQLEAAKRSFTAGAGTRTDIDDAQARYDISIAQEVEASQNVGFTRRQLETFVGQPVDALALLDPARMHLAPPMPANAEEWIARGEATNADLRAMRANVEAARQEVEKARAGHRPTVDLVAQRGRSQSASEQTINQLYLTTQLGVQVNIPIFAGGYVNSQVRQALANLERQQQIHEAKRREIGVQIRKEFQNVDQGVLKVKALEQAERSADQALFSNKKGFQAGTRSQVDILNAQQQLMNAKRDLAQARYMYIVARLRLQGLVGSLNETEVDDVNRWLVVAGSPDINKL